LLLLDVVLLLVLVLAVVLLVLVLVVVVDRQHRRGRNRVRADRVAVALCLRQQRGERAGERVDLVGVQQRPVGQVRLVLAEQALEAEQQREAAAPFRGGNLRARVDLLERSVERPATGAAGGKRVG